MNTTEMKQRALVDFQANAANINVDSPSGKFSVLSANGNWKVTCVCQKLVNFHFRLDYKDLDLDMFQASGDLTEREAAIFLRGVDLIPDNQSSN